MTYIPTGRRQIKNGYEFDRYFPKPDGKDIIVVKDGSVKDTLREMANVVQKYKDDCRYIAEVLRGRTREESIRNVHSFIWNYIQYKYDEQGKEQLKRPALLWEQRHTGGDCDDMAIFGNCCLDWMDIPVTFKAAGYDPKTKKLQHVYDVIYNKDGSYYSMDGVIGKAFYEKPYVSKLEYKMSNTLSGLPIHVLSGFGEPDDNELEQLLSGADFDELDGLASPQKELDTIYNYLVRTRNYILNNPSSVLMTGGAKNHIKLLNYAISNWHTANRDNALDVLEGAEEQWNELNGLSGHDDDDELDGLGRAKGKKKFWSKVKETTKKIGKGIKNAAKKIVQHSPLVMAARGGFLLAMKMNLFGMAKKLYPGYMSDAELKANGISAEEGARVRQAVAKIEQDFEKKGGKKDKLKNAIVEGRAKKKYDGLSGFGMLAGLGEVATATTATALTTASGALIKAGDALDKAGVKSEDKKKFGDIIRNFFKKLKEKRKAKKEARKARKAEKAGQASEGDSPGTSPGADEEEKEQETAEEESKEETLPEKKKEKEAGEESSFSRSWEGIKSFAKANGKQILTGAAVLTGIAYLFKNFAKPSPSLRPAFAGVEGLGEVKKYRKGKRIYGPGFLPKGKKIKSIAMNGIGTVAKYKKGRRDDSGPLLPKGKTIKSITLK